jgi:hypothetical protein
MNSKYRNFIRFLRKNINYNRYKLLFGELSALKLGKSERIGLVKPFETKPRAIEYFDQFIFFRRSINYIISILFDVLNCILTFV